MIRGLGDVILLVLNVAWRRRYLLIVPVLLLPPIAYYAGGKMPKSYTTKMSILIQEPAALNPFLEDFALSPNLKERIKPLQALLKSEHVLGIVLEDMGKIDANTPPAVRSSKIRRLSGSISSRLVGKEVIKLSIIGSQAKGLAATLKAVSKRFIERIVAPERSSVEGSEKFLRDQLLSRTDQLQQAEARLATFKVDNAADLPEIYRSNLGRLTTLQDLFDSKLIELAAAKRSLQDLRKRLSGTSPLIGNMEEQIVTLSSELISLKGRYTANHSKVRDVETKLDRLRAERSELLSASNGVSDKELDRLFNIALGQTSGSDDQGQSPFLVSQMLRLQDAQAHKIALEREVEQIHIKIGQLTEGIARFAPIERKMQGLERNIRIAQKLHERLLERYEMARVTGALGRFEAPERIKIIDEPSDPLSPITPGRILFLIGGIAGGIFMGIGLATLTEVLDPTVRSARELASRLELPILSRLSYIDLHPAPGSGNDPSRSSPAKGYKGPVMPGHPLTGGTSKRQKITKYALLIVRLMMKIGQTIMPLIKMVAPILKTLGMLIWKTVIPLLGTLIGFAFSKLGVNRRP